MMTDRELDYLPHACILRPEPIHGKNVYEPHLDRLLIRGQREKTIECG
jgi:hypothetical protein